MIAIRQRDGKWEVEIREEKWQFETKQEMKDCLGSILDMKEKYGQLKKEE